MSGALYSDFTRFRQIISALQYFTFTKPNICYVVNKVCQFMNALIEDHWVAIKHILRYLQAMTSYDLHITQGSSFSFHGFTNANYASCVDDCKFIGGVILCI